MNDRQVKARLIEMINEMPADQQRDLLKLLQWGHSDRRKHRRKNCMRKAVLTARNDRFEGIVKNLSDGGMFIETPANISVGQEVSLFISLFSFEEPLSVTGKVVRTEPMGVAVKFDGVFQNFINKISKRGSGETG